MEHIAKTKIIQNGDSVYAIIPASMRKVMGLQKGMEMNVFREGSKLIYEKVGDSPQGTPE